MGGDGHCNQLRPTLTVEVGMEMEMDMEMGVEVNDSRLHQQSQRLDFFRRLPTSIFALSSSYLTLHELMRMGTTSHLIRSELSSKEMKRMVWDHLPILHIAHKDPPLWVPLHT